MKKAGIVLLLCILLTTLYVPAYAFEFDDSDGVIWFGEGSASLGVFYFYKGECRFYYFYSNSKYDNNNEIGVFSVSQDPDNASRYILIQKNSGNPLILYITFNEDGTMTNTWDHDIIYIQKQLIHIAG